MARQRTGSLLGRRAMLLKDGNYSSRLSVISAMRSKAKLFPTVVKDKGDVGPELSQMAGMHPAEFFAESIINPNAVIDHDAKQNGYVGADGKSKMPEYNDTFHGAPDCRSHRLSDFAQSRRA